MKNDPYKKAGVDINAGNELVQQIKEPIKNTFNDNVLTDLIAHHWARFSWDVR